ncbi:hypothetical protein GCM10027055_30390 [Janibacter alkaliphilus]
MADRDPGRLPEALAAAADLVDGASRSGTWRLSDAEIAEALAELGRLRHLATVAEVALLRDGLSRGLPRDGGWGDHDWATRCEGDRAPDPAPGHVAQALRLARAGLQRGLVPDVDDDPNGSVADRDSAVGMDPCDAGREVDTGHDAGAGPDVFGVVERSAGTGDVLTAFERGDLAASSADRLVRFVDDVAPVADPTMLATDLGVLLHAARDGYRPGGPEGRGRPVRVGGMTDRELRVAITRTGRLLRPSRDLEQEHRAARNARRLHRCPGPAGMTSYRVTLDPEGSAVLDAALSALSRPETGPDGDPDTRTHPQRQADALVEIVRRGVSAPGEMPTTDKTQVIVTIPWTVLRDQALPPSTSHTGGQTALGGASSAWGATDAGIHGGGVTATGQVLPPSVVRRMACDAAILPAVLGGPSQILDLGRSARLFTAGQRRALWHRDQGCSYPGCTMLAQWCDAHHVTWWSRGGATDLSNAALLCPRHHTFVHERDLTATVTGDGVTWHT